MGTPAAVQGDQITATCPGHQIPAESGTKPAGPLPFVAAITAGCDSTVLIAGKPAAVMGSNGLNTSPSHAPIVDMPPPAQKGTVVVGSSTVLIGNTPAARTGSQCACCFGPIAQVTGSAATVLIA